MKINKDYLNGLIGKEFKSGGKNKTINTVEDYLITYNSKNEVVNIKLVSFNIMLGQKVYSYDTPLVAYERGKICRMKALEILLDERKQHLDIFEQNKELGNPNENSYIILLNEAIKELEELQNRIC